MRDTVDQLVRELLGHERPDPRPDEGGADAERRGNQRRGHGRVEELPHLETPGDQRDLHGVVGVHEEEQRERPERPGQSGELVEPGNGRGAEEDQRIKYGGDAGAHPEDRGAVRPRELRRLDDGGVEAGLDDHVPQVHEDEHDGEHAELLGGKKPGHDDLDRHLHDSISASLE